MPDETFVEQLKDALEHLYDPAQLRGHPLIRVLLPARLPLGVGPAQALRRVLLDGIEQLNFSAALPSGARQNRAHQILVLRYVEALPFREVMAELSLSQPQFHREQRHALEALAALLSETTKATEIAHHEADGVEGAYAELDAAVRGSEGPTDLAEVIASAGPMLIALAAREGIALTVETPTGSAPLANRTALRQLVIGLVGFVLCVGSGGEGWLRATPENDIRLSVRYRGKVDPVALAGAEARDRLDVVSHLATALDGSITVEHTDETLSLTARLPITRRTLLTIDDNPDAIQLVTRLLYDQHYTVLSAGTVREGLALARRSRPDVILLDIMLPDQDGWDAIQILKNDPTTQDLPVVICTVLAEARLALALGAADFIRKPLTRPRLIEALARWTSPPRSPAEGNRVSRPIDQSIGSPEAAGR